MDSRNVIICPNCKNENIKDSEICRNCRFPLTDKASQSSGPVKFCPNCKNPNRASTKACSACGYSFIEISSSGPLKEGATLINRYEIISLIKAEDKSNIYRVTDHRRLERCLIKEFNTNFISAEQREKIIKAFNQEGKRLLSLNYNNIVKVIDYFIQKNCFYIVMEFIDGVDLESKLNSKKTFTERETIKCTIQILNSLNYLHNQKPPVICGYLKPSNIIIRTRDERCILTDFGIEKILLAEDSPKENYGTEYSPLEQFDGLFDIKNDLYSMGALMHHMLTGIKPVAMRFQFEPLTKLKHEANKDMEAIVARAIEEKPEARYSSVKEMFLDIQKMKSASTRETGTLEKEEIETKKSEPIKTEDPSLKEKDGEKNIKEEIPAPKETQMILIQAGPFWMGDMDSEYNEIKKAQWEINRKGQHRVQMNPYHIDITPVTNIQYKFFVQQTGYKSQGDWEKYFTPGKEEHPVVNITWNDADNYARWKGKRLPSEAEWEKASRGSDGRTWPWGTIFDKSKLNARETGVGSTTKVGKYTSGKSVYGVLDTVGNVWEWTGDWYVPYPYEGPYTGKEGEKKVVRGGSFTNEGQKCKCSSRSWGFPENKSAFRGFRCAKDP